MIDLEKWDGAGTTPGANTHGSPQNPAKKKNVLGSFKKEQLANPITKGTLWQCVLEKSKKQNSRGAGGDSTGGRKWGDLRAALRRGLKLLQNTAGPQTCQTAAKSQGLGQANVNDAKVEQSLCNSQGGYGTRNE